MEGLASQPVVDPEQKHQQADEENKGDDLNTDFGFELREREEDEMIHVATTMPENEPGRH